MGLHYPVVVIAHLVAWWAFIKSLNWGEPLVAWTLFGMAVTLFIWSIAEGADLATSTGARFRRREDGDD